MYSICTMTLSSASGPHASSAKARSLEVARGLSGTSAAAKRAEPVQTVYLRRAGGQTCQLPSPLVVSNQGSRTRTAGYQQNSPRTDIFGSYSFDPDTALIDFHARPVKKEKQHPGAISIDEHLKGAKDIQGFKPVEYDNYDNIDIY